MATPTESLLKYDSPVSISIDRKSFKERGLKVSTQQPEHSGCLPVPPPPKPKSAPDASRQENQKMLNSLLPPREWMEGNQLWMQQVSSAPCTRTAVIQLEELLDKKLAQKQAKETGICHIRREIYSQCFDELLRQVTINCTERGLVLLRVRDEIQMTIDAYQTLYESSMAFGMRKALRAEQGKTDMEKINSDLEKENQAIKQQMMDDGANHDNIIKRENEKRQLEEKKNTEEIQFLKKANQQLKDQMLSIISSKK
ncbi:axonemal dynein light intermediate polypeptide 1 [Pseudoliparis swirei]|uniref:axonemal dynein light intermediate polypeptide 1 n=1 Tax=Pseudoliparis swirei TaxID=2059687 RepID=UPI0024BE1427|nr:axonemal dynein light intermediate polypeptide 1 [Pseudoliparis swirei]XP_056300987.1 axonemal dynein light intermediate polypeptide 1 [Pseudoliparis swirei]